MPVANFRESKSAATIRRRRRQIVASAFLPSSLKHKTNLDDTWDSGEEDPEIPFEPTQVHVRKSYYIEYLNVYYVLPSVHNYSNIQLLHLKGNSVTCMDISGGTKVLAVDNVVRKNLVSWFGCIPCC